MIHRQRSRVPMAGGGYLDFDFDAGCHRPRRDADLYQHNPVRYPEAHPYSFDPHTVYGFPGPHAECNETYYHDRLEQEDRAKYRDCWAQVDAQRGKPVYGGVDGSRTELFLRLYTGDAALRLLRVVRYCDNGGFSVYRYDVHSPQVAARQAARAGTAR